MALPTITYDSATGSNTLASGAGPATAVTGTTASATASTTVTVDAGKDISAVAVDGSAVLWFNSAAGARHFSKITGSAGSGGATPTFTIQDTITIAAVTWAVGGKRLHGEADTTRVDLKDAYGGWTFSFTGTGTYTQTVAWIPDATNGVSVSGAGGITITGDSRTSRATLNQTGNLRHLDVCEGMTVNNLIFTTSNGTNNATGAIRGFSNIGRSMRVSGCKITGLHRGLLTDTVGMYVEDTEIANCTDAGIYVSSATYGLTVNGCNIHNNNSLNTAGSGGINVASGQSGALYNVFNTLMYGNKRANIVIPAAAGTEIIVFGCTLDAPLGTTPDNIVVTGTPAVFRLNIVNSILTNPGVYNLNIPSTMIGMVTPSYNAYFVGAGTNNFNNIVAGTGDVILTATPYVDAAGGNYARNTTAGAGAACAQAGFPQTLIGSSTDCNFSIGADQSGAAGGGGVSVPVNRFGQESVMSA